MRNNSLCCLPYLGEFKSFHALI
uniref:Uncharacterized protein n=1 Tax=Rhizophora mucronata TaxID=61149 RepID=A0A2P2P1K2_RHIMU